MFRELVRDFLREPSAPAGYRRSKRLGMADLRRRLNESELELTVPAEEVLHSINRIKPARIPVEKSSGRH